jgi:hypothetical protein
MNIHRLLADFVVAIHLAYAGFIVLGMLAILLGIVFKWRWVRNFWFRTIHLLMITAVVVEELLGIECPLTGWENSLRWQAGETVREGTFIGRLLHDILFWEVPPEIMTIVYCLIIFALLVGFIVAPPRWPGKKGNPDK